MGTPITTTSPVAIRSIYAVTLILINLVLHLLVYVTLPSTSHLYTSFPNTFNGEAPGFINLPMLISLVVTLPLFAFAVTVPRPSAIAFHLNVALSILAAFFLLVALFSITVLPVFFTFLNT